MFPSDLHDLQSDPGRSDRCNCTSLHKYSSPLGSLQQLKLTMTVTMSMTTLMTMMMAMMLMMTTAMLLLPMMTTTVTTSAMMMIVQSLCRDLWRMWINPDGANSAAALSEASFLHLCSDVGTESEDRLPQVVAVQQLWYQVGCYSNS